MAGRPRVEIPPHLHGELRERIAAGQGIDPIHAWLKGLGWPGSLATLAVRIGELRIRPEAQVADALAAEAARPAAAAEAPPPGSASAPEPPDAAPEVEGLAERKPRDTIADLREAQALMRALARRAVEHLKKGGGSEGLALKAIDSYAGLTLKIRRLEREEASKQVTKNYRIVEVRMPAKDTIQ